MPGPIRTASRNGSTTGGMPSKAFESESSLAAAVIGWLKLQGWDVYQEVQCATYGRTADIVAVRASLTWIIEAKLSMTLAVLEQAHKWNGWANLVSIAVPATTGKALRGSQFASLACHHFGIGVIKVEHSGRRESFDHYITSREGSRSRRLIGKGIAEMLHERQRDFAPAGNPDGARFTPYGQTCEELSKIVTKQPGISLKDALRSLQHHYSSVSSARTALTKWGLKGTVKGVEFRRTGKAINLFPHVLAS